jgi:hypothetical protein
MKFVIEIPVFDTPGFLLELFSIITQRYYLTLKQLYEITKGYTFYFDRGSPLSLLWFR